VLSLSSSHIGMHDLILFHKPYTFRNMGSFLVSYA
jgi:hypothetical protein